MNSPMTSFSDLPRELRDQIYRFCVSDHIITHKKPSAAVREDSLTITRNQTPPAVCSAVNSNLLCLNRQIYHEAHHIARSTTFVQIEFSVEQSFQRYPTFACIEDYFPDRVVENFGSIKCLKLILDLSHLSAPIVALTGLYEITTAFPNLEHLTLEVHCDANWFERCFPEGKVVKASDLFQDHDFARLEHVKILEKLIIVCDAFALHGSELANGAPWGLSLLRNPPWLHRFRAMPTTNARYAWNGLDLDPVGRTYTIDQVFYEARCRLSQWVSERTM